MTLSRLDSVFSSGERCSTPDLGARERERGTKKGPSGVCQGSRSPWAERDDKSKRKKGDTIVQICEPRTL